MERCWFPRLGHQLPDPATRQPGRRRGDPGQVLRPASLLTDPVGSHDGKVPVQDRPPAHHHAGAWDVRGHPQRHLDYRGGAQGRGLRDARHREVAPRAEELGRHAPRARLRFVGGLPERSNRKGATGLPQPPRPPIPASCVRDPKPPYQLDALSHTRRKVCPHHHASTPPSLQSLAHWPHHHAFTHSLRSLAHPLRSPTRSTCRTTTTTPSTSRL